MLARPSCFADRVQPSAFENISRAISRGRLVGETSFTRFDEVGIFSEAAGVDIQGDAMLPADLLCFAGVGHRHGLAAAGVVGDREHHERDFLGALAIDQLLEAKRVHVSLEGKEVGGFFGFGRGQVDRRSADEFAIRAGGVEVRVVWDDVAFLASDIKRMRSAARPWCVGITWRNPKIACTASRKRAKLGEPA